MHLFNCRVNNEDEEPIEPEYIELTRDSVGHLVVKIYLEALRNADLEANTLHDLKIVAELKEAQGECVEREGIGEIYIIDKNLNIIYENL